MIYETWKLTNYNAIERVNESDCFITYPRKETDNILTDL